jgi:Flp pilus assembly pilin Flp
MTGRLSHHSLTRIRRDVRGAVLVEFALLAPVILTLLFGVVQVGIHMQNYNAIRNLASDGARFAVVEYQQGNELSATAVQAEIESRGFGPKYNLNSNLLTVQVTEPATRIAGLKEMNIRITYDMPDFLAFVDTDALTLDYQRPVFLVIPPA